MNLEPYVEERLRSFLDEDLGLGDITTDSTVDEEVWASAIIICKEDAVVAGIEEAAKVFELLGCTAKPLVEDGAQVGAGTPILRLEGWGRAILKGERTALNLLMRMSGIATMTRRVLLKARKVNGRVRIACTRKTAPGLRYFDKKAVVLGGGDPHRFRLDDCVLIKDNHIRLVGSVREAIKRAKSQVSFTKKVEVEAENVDQALEAALSGADIVMLDNMEVGEVRRFLERLEEMGLRDRVVVEASGGINEQNVEEYAKTGVDVISMGSLTHSARAVDMSLEIEEVKRLRQDLSP